MNRTNGQQHGSTAVKRQVAVVTDSATALTDEMARDYGLYVAPMEITIGNQTYLDGPVDQGGSLEKFYDLLRTAERLPTTSAPKPDRWLECFRKASSETLAASLAPMRVPLPPMIPD